MARTPHRITNADLERKVGDCSVCGPGVRLRVQVRDGKVKRGCKPAKRRSDGTPITPIRATLEQLEAALEAQGGACAICREELELVPDHDHVTGAFRAWLCRDCNLALGFMRDRPERLRAAAEYLEGLAKLSSNVIQ